MVYLTGRAANVTYAVFHRVYRTGRGGILGSFSLSGMADTQGVSNIRKGRPYVYPLPPSLPARYGACPLCTAHCLAYRRYGRHTGMSEADYVPTVCAVQGGTGADCVCTDPTYTRLLPRTMVTCTQWIPHREGCVYIPEFPLRYAHTPACRIRHIHICTQCVFLQQGGVSVYTTLCQ